MGVVKDGGEIKLVENKVVRGDKELIEEESLVARFGEEEAKQIIAYHRTMPGYQATPLRTLEQLAGRLGIGKLWVKDESYRFNLKAFKAVGSSYALARSVMGEGTWPISFEDVKAQVPASLLLVTATDGNHGFGVAYLAKLFGCRAKIIMPAGSVEERAQRIRNLGAECTIMEVNYDACVLLASALAKESGGLLIMDTAVEEDTEEERKMPLAIMQGYMTIIQEFTEQCGVEEPTHVFLQAGVGSFSGGLAAHISHIMPKTKVVIVETREADCIFRSAVRGDGVMEVVDDDYTSIMAGLCCGVPSVQGWPILRKTASFFLSCTDSVTSKGMRVLYSPLGSDPKIVSGESGAVTLGALALICTEQRFSEMKESLGLDADSKVLLVSTESDTDPEGFMESIWGLTR